MELKTAKISAIGIFKDDELVAVVIQNGKPVHYETKEMGNSEIERLYEVDKAQI